MKKKFQLLFAASFVILFIVLGTKIYVHGADCAPNCAKKDIGDFSALGNYIPFLTEAERTLTVNKSYWIRLAVKGKNTTATTTQKLPSNIMLIWDTSSSMLETIPYDSSGSKPPVQRLDAAKDAIRSFIQMSSASGVNDSIGLGSFTLCGQYASSTTNPVVWAYEGYSPAKTGEVGFGVMHFPLAPLGGNEQKFYTFLDNFTFNSSLGKPTWCTKSHGSTISGSGYNGGTSIGAGITIGNSQLSPILTSAVRKDATRFDTSTFTISGKNFGPPGGYTAMQASQRVIVLATDGQEGQYPKVYDDEIDPGLLSIVQTAKRYGTKIYILGFDGPTGTYTKIMCTQVIDVMNGNSNCDGPNAKMFAGVSRQDMLNSYTAIRNQISNDATVTTSNTTRLEEFVNSPYFTVSTPIKPYNSVNASTYNFKVTKTVNGGAEQDVTCQIPVGGTLPSCVTSADAGNVKVNLGPIPDNEVRYVYIKVSASSATDTLPDKKTYVDGPSSYVYYSDGTRAAVDNLQVQITGVVVKPYFETQNGGDVHSAGGLKVELPSTTNKFIRGTYPGILSYSGSAVVTPTSNQLSTKNWKIGGSPGYGINSSRFTYSSLYDNIKNHKSISNLGQITGSGFYDITGDLTVDSINKFPNLKTGSTQIVVFVSGNVYIKTSIPLFGNTNNKSSLTIISAKNIGINTAVKDSSAGVVDGIYIADGVIDTACNATFSLSTCSPTAPTLDASSLTLQGMFLARSGFNLERQGQPETGTPGEAFIYKPELLLTSASQLGSLSSVWREVTP